MIKYLLIAVVLGSLSYGAKVTWNDGKAVFKKDDNAKGCKKSNPLLEERNTSRKKCD